MWTLLGGEANGSLTLRFRGIQQAEDVLRFYLEIRDQLDELVNHVLEVTLNHQPLELKDMTEGQEFQINVRSKSFPRATTVDLVTGYVTYLHEAFWKWDDTQKGDPKKLSESQEVYDVAAWLIDWKEFRLVEPFEVGRYRALASQFRAFSIAL